MPCGTWLTVKYHGRSVRVQVIDRGPYVYGREYDLTQNNAETLGITSVGVATVQVGAFSYPR